MSTVAEIEAAAAALPQAELTLLLKRLEKKIQAQLGEVGHLIMEDGRPVLVAPADAPVMTPEFVKSLLGDFP